MLREFGAGTRLAARYGVRLVVLGSQFSLMVAVMAFALGDALTQAQALRAGQELRRAHATVFTVYYKSGDVSDVPRAARTSIERWMTQGRGYGTVVGNGRVDDKDFAGGTPTVLVMGPRFADVNRRLGLCAAPCAMRGKDTELSVGDRLDFSGSALAVKGTLPPSATLFTAGEVVELDDTVLVNLPVDWTPKLSDVELEELAGSMVLIGPKTAEITDYVEDLEPGGLVSVPTQLATSQLDGMSRNLAMAALYLLAGAAFGALMIVVFFVTTDSILRRERAALTLRRRYGATGAHLGARVAGLVLPVVLAPTLPILLGLQVIGGPVAAAARYLGVAVIGVAAVLGAGAVRRHVTDQEART